jgi:hypothetical protein
MKKKSRPRNGKRKRRGIVGEVTGVSETKNTYKVHFSFPLDTGIRDGAFYVDKKAGPPSFTTITIG